MCSCKPTTCNCPPAPPCTAADFTVGGLAKGAGIIYKVLHIDNKGKLILLNVATEGLWTQQHPHCYKPYTPPKTWTADAYLYEYDGNSFNVGIHPTNKPPSHNPATGPYFRAHKRITFTDGERPENTNK